MNNNKYPGKKLCTKCGNNYHPDNFEMCWNCWSSQTARIEQYKPKLKENTTEAGKSSVGRIWSEIS